MRRIFLFCVIQVLALSAVFAVDSSSPLKDPNHPRCINGLAKMAVEKMYEAGDLDPGGRQWVDHFAEALHWANQFAIRSVRYRSVAFQEHLQNVNTRFAQNSGKALQHIIEGDWVSSTGATLDRRLSGGLHTSSSYFNFIHELVEAMQPNQRAFRTEALRGPVDFLLVNMDFIRQDPALKASVVDSILRTGNSPENLNKFADSSSFEETYDELGVLVEHVKATLEEFRVYGLDIQSPRDRVAYLARSLIITQRPQAEDNGVVKVLFSPLLVRAKTWRDQMVPAALNGAAPLGAKTFFPTNWNGDKIKMAISSILNSPDTRVLREDVDSHASYKQVLLEGIYEGVKIRVAIHRDQVVSAYPSWHQKEMSYAELRSEEGRSNNFVDEQLETLHRLAGLPKLDLTQAYRIYYGLEASGLSPNELRAWQELLDPRWAASTSDSNIITSDLYRRIDRGRSLPPVDRFLIYQLAERLRRHLGESQVYSASLGRSQFIRSMLIENTQDESSSLEP